MLVVRLYGPFFLCVVETDASDSKTKAEMKDISTQTTPISGDPPPNVLHNGSHDELSIQKINNNCNVGNGPITLLPNNQIKDYTL